MLAKFTIHLIGDSLDCKRGSKARVIDHVPFTFVSNTFHHSYGSLADRGTQASMTPEIFKSVSIVPKVSLIRETASDMEDGERVSSWSLRISVVFDPSSLQALRMASST